MNIFGIILLILLCTLNCADRVAPEKAGILTVLPHYNFESGAIAGDSTMVLPHKNTPRYRESRRKWYQKNKIRLRKEQKVWRDRNKDKRHAYMRKWQKEAKQWFYDYKKPLSCKCCGYNTCPDALVFHHKDHNLKKFSIAWAIGNLYPRDVIMKEISKCQVLCHNCHAELHAQMRAENNTSRKQDESKESFLF